ncbi:Fe2+-dependent dioxygenase [Synoicihabitans lomoniglobus]|uniref:Fe2+-dependent dioxygenase n=1 Tax=Synoicihabitans lomoniglobus TaxID=2909285 RepID=A0AAF0CNH0_9BACT|nr:Fe2+-dependent dioxygenase [Opitutaceae bacterium LMO-M01]WED65508.1 Fe2+-dependent dioxygenase [Opitutaceae bacterium LMO-M01]
MILSVTDIITPETLATCRAQLEAADWVDGKASAGHQGALVKNNEQLPAEHPVAVEVGNVLLQALSQNPMFMSAALPLNILPPMFNRYAGGQTFGTHVDGSIRTIPGTGQRLRTDLSCTFFFSEPDEYDGGELIIEDTYGSKSVKLPAGQMVLYPSTSLHRVTPVTRGTRLCSFFWLQSMIRSDQQRSTLFDLDVAIQRFGKEMATHPSVVQLTGVYHNLLRQWAEM